jgi:hypothetical protein
VDTGGRESETSGGLYFDHREGYSKAGIKGEKYQFSTTLYKGYQNIINRKKCQA